MPSRLLIAGAAALVLVWLLLARRDPSPPTLPGPESEARIQPRHSSANEPPSRPSSASGPTSPDQLSPSLESEIEAAVVTYSPAALPTFERLLASGEPAVREAACDGLIRLGEKSGAALLRRATARLTDADEIRRFEEAARLLELPSATEGPLKPAKAAD